MVGHVNLIWNTILFFDFYATESKNRKEKDNYQRKFSSHVITNIGILKMKKIYIFDTSVLLTDACCIFNFKNNDIIIPLKVLDEIDGKKKRQDAVGSNARTVIRALDRLREKGPLTKGVRLSKGKGRLIVRGHDLSALPPEWDSSAPDNMIISTAIAAQGSEPKRKVILVTRDINMRVKCDSVGIATEDYAKEKVIKDSTKLYTGTSEVLVDEQDIDSLYNGNEVFLDEDKHKFYPNQFLMLISNQNDKKTALAMFQENNKPLKRIKEFKKKVKVQNIKPKNKEQMYALNLLMDVDVPIVSLIGKAGSGKTLIALAAGLEQVMVTQEYSKLIVTKPVIPVGKEIGFLPGTLEDKMAPWLAPIRDNLEYLSHENGFPMEQYMQDGTIEMEALTYIRGRSIANAFMIIDEAQNLTTHELKTILTRVGAGTKIVLTGDIEQIDNLYIDETSNGLTCAVERFKEYKLAGHVTLQRGERSAVASLSAKSL